VLAHGYHRTNPGLNFVAPSAHLNSRQFVKLVSMVKNKKAATPGHRRFLNQTVYQNLM
jgi:hypothetical protein